MAAPGEMLLIRAGKLVKDYGRGRVSEADRGRGFSEMLQATLDGDSIECGPLRAAVANPALRANRVRMQCSETQLVPSGSHTCLFQAAGSGCFVSGLCVDGLAAPNGGNGFGFWVTGAENHLDGCVANGNRGRNHTNGDGSGIKIDGNAVDTIVTNFASDDAGYASLWFNGCNRVTVRGAKVTNPYRAISINSPKNIDWMRISDLTGIATIPGKSVLINSNIADGYSLGELQLTNVSVTDTDMVGNGISYQQSEGHQMCKLQNIRKVVMDKVRLDHGINSGTGVIRTFYIQQYMGNTAPEELIMRACSFADTLVVSLKIPYWHMEDCSVCDRTLQNYANAFRVNCGQGKFHGNRINIHGRKYAMTPAMPAETKDRLEFRHNRYLANTADTAYASSVSLRDDFFDDTNRLQNKGGGSFQVAPQQP